MSQDSHDPNKEWDGGEDAAATATLPPTPATQAAADEQLPEDYKSLMALHQQLYHAIPREKSKSARAKLTARHNAVKSKLAALQNGNPHPTITADDHARTAIARQTRPASRAARLEKLKAAVASSAFPKMAVKPLRPVSKVIEWLLKGAGVDCVHLVAGIYLAIGAVNEFLPGDYTLDEGSHLKSSKVTGWFAHHPDFIGVEDPYLAGDILCFNLAQVGHHVGMVLGPEEFIHVYAQRGRFAIVSNLRESFFTRHIVGVYRLTQS